MKQQDLKRSILRLPASFNPRCSRRQTDWHITCNERHNDDHDNPLVVVLKQDQEEPQAKFYFLSPFLYLSLILFVFMVDKVIVN